MLLILRWSLNCALDFWLEENWIRKRRTLAGVRILLHCNWITMLDMGLSIEAVANACVPANVIFPQNSRREVSTRRWPPRCETGLEVSRYQMAEPSLWMATQASMLFPTLIGSTFQNMMKGVPSFL